MKRKIIFAALLVAIFVLTGCVVGSGTIDFTPNTNLNLEGEIVKRLDKLIDEIGNNRTNLADVKTELKSIRESVTAGLVNGK